MRFNQNSTLTARIFLHSRPALGQCPCPIRTFVFLSDALALAQLDHEPKGFLAICVWNGFKRRVTAERSVSVAVDLGKLAPRIGLHIALRDPTPVVVKDAEHQLAFSLAAFGRAKEPRRSFAVIGTYAHTAVVHEADAGKRPRLVLLGEGPPDLKRRFIIAGIKGRQTATEIVIVGPTMCGAD